VDSAKIEPKLSLVRAMSGMKGNNMAQPVGIIGLDPEELGPVRMLVSLLRHADPSVGNLARKALEYVADTAITRGPGGAGFLDQAG
jgi:hypothetical protein